MSAPEKSVQFEATAEVHGFTMMPNVVLLDTRLSAGAKITYCALRYFAREAESCWPGQERLAEMLTTTSKTLRGYIAELSAVGLLHSKRRGLTQSNLYVLTDLTRWVERAVQEGVVLPMNNTKEGEGSSPSPSTSTVESTVQQGFGLTDLPSTDQEVITTLNGIADKHGLTRPRVGTVIKTMRKFADRDAMEVARRMDIWSDDPSRTIKSVASTYDTFMQRSEPRSKKQLEDAVAARRRAAAEAIARGEA